jgi:AmmeMemoRadiSam system protein B
MEFLSGIREASLPPGWYPRDESEARKMLQEWTSGQGRGSALAAVSPHAGWVFSGRLAALAVNSLRPSDTIVICGGHLHASSPMLYAPERAFETPAGVIESDGEFLEAVFGELREAGIPAPQPDRAADNSVEVLLPMLAILHPKSRVLWFRSPPRGDAKALGEAIGRVADTLGKSVSCLGSTDLTHYGPAYGFTPAGMGEKAEKWVRNINDKGFIAELLDMNCEKAIANALKKNSACSPGAAVTAMGFALEAGASESRLLGYSTSLDVHRAESFVGYAAVVFLKDQASP